jgi:DNA-binding FadR family transcriptional regulator
MTKSVSEHAKVVDAIVQGDGDHAYASMRSHMLTVSDASSVFATRPGA